MIFAQFQEMALIPERDELFIETWELKVGIHYPRNLISTLNEVADYGRVRHK